MKLENGFQSMCRNKQTTILVIILALVSIQFFVQFPSPTFNGCADDTDNKSLESQQLPVPVTFAFELNYVEKNLQMMDQFDPRLIQYTRNRYLTPPSQLPYMLDGHGMVSDSYSQLVIEIFGNKKNGTFIEAGAFDGLDASHTLHLEKNYGWKGLLIECNPILIPKLKSRHRKAWIAGVCLAPGSKPGTLPFSYPPDWIYSGTVGKKKHDQWGWMGKGKDFKMKWTDLEVDTIPLFSVLSSVGLTQVDYFSFDIEGVELSVLKEFPFDKFTFKLLIIEIIYYNDEQKKELNKLLISNKYEFVSDYDKDKIYVHSAFKKELNLKRFHH